MKVHNIWYFFGLVYLVTAIVDLFFSLGIDRQNAGLTALICFGFGHVFESTSK